MKIRAQDLVELDNIMKDLGQNFKGKAIVREYENNTQANNPDNLAIILKMDFDIDEALTLIGEVDLLCIFGPSRFDRLKLEELIRIMTSKNKVKVVQFGPKLTSYETFNPTFDIGDKQISGNYEYSYGQKYLEGWTNVDGQEGWGTRIIDNTKTNCAGPLTFFKGNPVLDKP